MRGKAAVLYSNHGTVPVGLRVCGSGRSVRQPLRSNAFPRRPRPGRHPSGSKANGVDDWCVDPRGAEPFRIALASGRSPGFELRLITCLADGLLVRSHVLGVGGCKVCGSTGVCLWWCAECDCGCDGVYAVCGTPTWQGTRYRTTESLCGAMTRVPCVMFCQGARGDARGSGLE